MKKITDFVDGFIPDNIPKKEATLIRAELTCHIMDKVDYYKDIGYNDMESIDKAIADFGTDECDKNFIFNEFEELYSERDIFAVGAFFIVAVMNFLCFPLDLWVTSADFNRDPDPASAFMSFCMIFVVLGMIVFARIKKYRKTLTAIGIINTLLSVLLLVSMYPQMAAYTISSNLIYLVDLLTPFSMGHLVVMAEHGLLSMAIWEGILLIPAIYCFVTAVRIKKGKANSVTNPKKTATVFVAVFAAISVFSCLLQPVGAKYVDDYPVWFNCFNNTISDVSQQRFDEISLGDTYSEVSKKLREDGYTTIADYEKTLDRLTKKQFRKDVEVFTFPKGYDIWFMPDTYVKGNGFIALRAENNIITGKSVGNVDADMYNEKEQTFGYTSVDYKHDVLGAIDDFRSLKKGDSEPEVMSKFGSDAGFIYTKRFSVEGEKRCNYYRIYSYGKIDPEAKKYEGNDHRYIELLFEDGRLIRGVMYDHIYREYKHKVESEKVK